MSQRVEHALAVYHRYVVEFVEALNLCPWAEEARRLGQVRVEVFEGAFDGDAVRDFIDRVAADDALAIGIAVFVDLLEMPRGEWLDAVAKLQAVEARRHGDRPPPMAMAAFHPDGGDDISTPGRLTSFIRRSPDVTLQLVRQTALAAVRDDASRRTAFFDPETMDAEAFLATRRPDHFGDRIVAANRKSIERYGVAEAAALLAELHRLRRQVG